MLGSGNSGQVPVEERSTRAAGAAPVAPSRPARRDQAPDPVLVSPLQQTDDRQWTPLAGQPAAAEPQQLASTAVPRSYSRPAQGELNPAVIALLNRANQAERAGQLEQSAASLERALRIQPDNAWLWHRLALLRLFQQQQQEAISTAEKSNSLALGNRRLLAENWRVIAQARERLGQQSAARAAARKAEMLDP